MACTDVSSRADNRAATWKWRTITSAPQQQWRGRHRQAQEQEQQQQEEEEEEEEEEEGCAPHLSSPPSTARRMEGELNRTGLLLKSTAK